MALEFTIVNEEPRVTLSARLDGTRYLLDLRWNTREEFWSLALFSDQNDIVMGHQRITLLVDMLRSHASADLPAGALVAVDTSGRDVEPGRYDLSNGRVKLVYLTAEEVANAS